jgi:hypothetical protein
MLATAIALTSAAADDPGNGHQNLGPGCAPDRPAVAHRAGGVIAVDPSGKNHDPAPIPCYTKTGWRTSEIGFVVANNGNLVLQPVFDGDEGPIGAITSTNQGITWEFVRPTMPDDPPRKDGFDENLGIDRKTGRIFWITPDYPLSQGATGELSRLDASDDGGKTFFRASVSPLGVSNIVTGNPQLDHPQVFAGPAPPRLRGLMREYPNVVYACQGNRPQVCGRSLDGGKTFALPTNLPSGCSSPTPHAQGLHGVVDNQGTVYLPYSPCQLPLIAISDNAGNSWRTVQVADTLLIGFGMLSLDIDKAGNLYAGWVDSSDRLPRLSISRDRGEHWSAPLVVSAPKVNEAALPTLVVGDVGQIAITYLGSTNSPGVPFPPPCALATVCPAYANETWNTYITETWNALNDNPLFWSAPINNPAYPTWYGCSPSLVILPSGAVTFGCSAGTALGSPGSDPDQIGGHVDYYGMNMAPDGTPWIGFFQACPLQQPVPGNPNCDQAAGGDRDSLWALVGRLVRVKQDQKEAEND